jgi:hypothetical protein
VSVGCGCDPFPLGGCVEWENAKWVMNGMYNNRGGEEIDNSLHHNKLRESRHVLFDCA